MGQRLIDSLRTVTLVVIDFEYTTPTGAPPEPIEIAVQALNVRDGRLTRTAQWESLIRPPQHAGLTSFDTAQTGITDQMLTDQPPAEQVLARVDRRFTAGPYVLLAHHAPAEARILFHYRESCPNLAHLDLIDTVRLARDLYPALPRHGLDELLHHLQIPAPTGRHRAMADVQATTEVFIAMAATADWASLRHLRDVAGYAARAAQPEQKPLFQ